MANITPIGDKVLIKRLDAEQTTKGGILLPDTAREKPKQGSIIALGDGKRQKDGSRASFQVVQDDTVLFSSYAGTEVKIDGEEYLIVSEDEILAVLN